MKKLLLLTILIFSFSLLILSIKNVNAQSAECSNTSNLDLDQINKCLDELNNAKTQSENATKPLEAQINGIKSRIAFIERDLVVKEKNIDDGYRNLERQQEILNTTIRDYYIKSYNNSPLLLLLSSDSVADLTKILGYQKATADRDKTIIINIVVSISGLEERKKALESEKKNIAVIKDKLDKIVTGAKAYQASLSSQIAQLSERQKSIIAARSGSAVTSVGSVPIGSDFNASIAFKPSAPADSFAAFSFGAYTHRNGMSQYGAKKLAESKDYKEIIQWYYGHGVKKDEGMPTTIAVQGYDTMDFQTYLYGIAEMPSDWPLNALKAQAIAARTYAMRTGKPICTTESCQVFLKSKSDIPPALWKQAVDETNKEVIDGDVSAQYSSTAGGYLNTSGWDTTDRTNNGDWTSRALESQAGSPWFYKAWYRQGYSNSGNNCGRSHPWISQEEMADILNAWIVRKNPNGAETGRIIPVTINQCGISGVSGNPYSLSELRDKANNSGGAITSISSVTTSNNNSGQTTNIHFETNRGGIDISGSEFKETFNVRAPGYLSIPQSGFAFFNIEKK